MVSSVNRKWRGGGEIYIKNMKWHEWIGWGMTTKFWLGGDLVIIEKRKFPMIRNKQNANQNLSLTLCRVCTVISALHDIFMAKWAWWLPMAWCLFGTRAWATIIEMVDADQWGSKAMCYGCGQDRGRLWEQIRSSNPFDLPHYTIIFRIISSLLVTLLPPAHILSILSSGSLYLVFQINCVCFNQAHKHRPGNYVLLIGSLNHLSEITDFPTGNWQAALNEVLADFDYEYEVGTSFYWTLSVIRLEGYCCHLYPSVYTWWYHGTISKLLALCEGNPQVTCGFPSKRGQ